MLKIVIIEDDSQIAEGLKYSIEFNKKYTVTAIYLNAEDAISNLSNNVPDIIILDINLPGKSGLEIIPDLKKLYPNCEILMLTSSDKDEDVFNALRLGASGYLNKDLGIEDLFKALDEIMAGGSSLSGNIARKVISSFRSEENDISLTKQESSVLKLMIEGNSQKSISEKLFISIPTVKFHSNSIYEKLGVHSKADAVAKALTLKLV
ncbi:MAG: response regulator transcription factor [Melioribacteraceae bacterium]|nr:response regulator transcription factor [Melioribacteraceae bacterium]MCF8264092.1 response regulator transcription factor [Melioribacteraceae bacterium]MCF8432660.1 response regulator transcription factor [Melioribacteraceae bacterium]